MYSKKLLLVIMGFSLTFLYSGDKVLAQDNQSTLTVGMPSTSRISTPVNDGAASPTGQIISVSVDPIPGSDSNSNLVSQEIIDLIISSREAAGAGSSPDKILICLSDPCAPNNNSNSNSIRLNDLTSLVESDLNQAFNDLVAAEQAASDGLVASDDSRRIVRRESDANEYCGCAPGEITISREPSKAEEYISRRNIKTVAEARQIVETKLEESSAFVEKVNQLKPENSLW